MAACGGMRSALAKRRPWVPFAKKRQGGAASYVLRSANFDGTWPPGLRGTPSRMVRCVLKLTTSLRNFLGRIRTAEKHQTVVLQHTLRSTRGQLTGYSAAPLHHLSQVTLVGAPALSIRMPCLNIHSRFTAMSGSRECHPQRIGIGIRISRRRTIVESIADAPWISDDCILTQRTRLHRGSCTDATAVAVGEWDSAVQNYFSVFTNKMTPRCDLTRREQVHPSIIHLIHTNTVTGHKQNDAPL